jgi:hypothetical protein
MWITSAASAQGVPEKSEMAAKTAPIDYVLIHPLFKADYMCGEHWEGQLAYTGDDLGSDCVVTGGLPADGKTGFSRVYRSDGRSNEDWYGWMEPVLAPFDGTVVRIHINPVVNNPGQLGKPPASFVLFRNDDGTMVLIAHVADITVKDGDRVTAGQPFAKVGNNGFGRSPHIHVGAWRERTPLQIRFDLRAMGKIRKQ